jgi:hypothetical protein
MQEPLSPEILAVKNELLRQRKRVPFLFMSGAPLRWLLETGFF